MNTRRLLVTGGSGYLGSEILARITGFETHATSYTRSIDPDVLPTARSHRLDLRDRAATERLLDEVRPDVVLHTAGSNRGDANLESIVPGARFLGRASLAHGFRLVHVSTDLVFDGEAAPYDESAKPAPLGPYGEAKAEAERELLALDGDIVLVRTSLIYGFLPIDHQTRWLLDGIESGSDVRLFTDERRCPIWVRTLADAMIELANATLRGVLNVAGHRAFDRHTFGMRILERLGIQPPPNVRPSTIAESGLTRPRDLTLDTSKAASRLRTPLVSIDELPQDALSA